METMSKLTDVLSHLQNSNQNPCALNEFVNGQWVSFSTQQVLQQIKEIALGLVALGIKRGENIAILAYSSPQWTMIDLGIIIAGGVTVSIFPNISEENLIYQVNETDARIVFLDEGISPELYPTHEKIFNRVIHIQTNNKETQGLTLEKIRFLGRQKEMEEPHKYQELLNALKPNDLATIIYTSGSTGTPKGAEITQYAMTSLISFEGFSWDPQNDRYLNILPLAHVFGRMLNFCLFAWGVSIYYLNDVKLLPIIAQSVHPTILVVVPRLLEKVYAKMLAKVDHAGFLKRTIGHWAFDLANDEHDSLYKQMMHPIADKIVYSSLRETFGGKVRIIISGGAPLDQHLAHFFIDVGLPIYEGWGLTEAATVCVNHPGQRKIGTVGKPITKMQIKCSPEGEVLAKGPVLMTGYYRNKEATRAAFDEEGWLKTGDKGFIDQDGYLVLVGRIKEMLKTSTGEYVVPIPIEQAIAKAPLVDMAMVIADRRKYATCLLFPDLEVLQRLKQNYNLAHVSDEELLKSPIVRSEMQRVLNQINQHLNKSEKIQDFRFISHPPSIENGELTPSMKIRRDVVEDKYKSIINSMYPEEPV